MKRVNLADVPEQEIRSPGGKFHSYFRNVSLALGGQRNVGTWGGGQPFDFQVRRIPPGAAVCPYHLHLAQWEVLMVQQGTGTVRAPDGHHPVQAGDVFVHPPGTPHQLVNTGSVDLEVFIFADNPPLDSCYYPDSNKWMLRPPGKIFRMTETDYLDGEEESVPGAPAPVGFPPPPEMSPVPFAKRRVTTSQMAWESWKSPKGKFHEQSIEISIGLGAVRNAAPGLGGHPFDLCVSRIPPRVNSWPYHWHAAQWEMYFILTGTATFRTADGVVTGAPGDVFLCPPYDAHQIGNATDAEMSFLLVADNPPVDYCHYPDSGKWGVREPRKVFQMTEADYFAGEE